MDIVVAITLFVLALLIGVEVIGKVPATLHTPLMSGSNFVHGAVLVGSMWALGHAEGWLQLTLGILAVLLGAASAAGGYVAHAQMLWMVPATSKLAIQSH